VKKMGGTVNDLKEVECALQNHEPLHWWKEDVSFLKELLAEDPPLESTPALIRIKIDFLFLWPSFQENMLKEFSQAEMEKLIEYSSSRDLSKVTIDWAA
jgi:hypothetical protein